ncbi:PspC domain-containing protein [Paenibacillus sp.]|uniref:PspC domain-containing protein n=1 Tax=Paenibacillus sp. TaxID=58172 RepID=UPI0028121882|nr:PspC domain-containing protein [Paenibacillus sp.]
MRRVYRSSRDKKLFGVCGGLAEATGIDATIIRIVLVITAVFSGGAPIPIYIIAAMVMPKDPTYGPHFGGHGSHLGGYGSHFGGSGSYGASNWDDAPKQQPWGTPPPPPPPPHQPPHYGTTSQGYYPPNEPAKAPSIDDLMEDIEKKAMAKEIEQLKAKLAKLENETKGDD